MMIVKQACGKLLRVKAIRVFTFTRAAAYKIDNFPMQPPLLYIWHYMHFDPL